MQIQETNLKFGQLKNRSTTKRIILHHTASGDVPASEVHRWHLNNGWSGIGYHYLIRTDGSIERGRPENTIGAHAGPEGNGDSIGIALVGNFETTKPSDKQLESLVWLIMDLQAKYGQLDIIGHKDVAATACPGRHFDIEKVRRLVKGDEVLQDVKIIVKDKVIAGKLIDGITYAPFRELIETLNNKIEWDGKNNVARVE